MARSLSELVQEARARIREIGAEDLDEWLGENDEIVLVDVREPYEFERGHISNAMLIPRGTLEGAADPHNEHRIEALCTARDKTVVLYCETGARSALAADTLKQMGFDDVYNLAGGIKLWEAEDLEVEAGPYLGPLP